MNNYTIVVTMCISVQTLQSFVHKRAMAQSAKFRDKLSLCLLPKR
jgi:hypothetical protein